MANILTLESVSQAFVQWRTNRTSPSERIPDPLRQQALALLERHTKAQVVSALQINHSALKRWQHHHSERSACEFVSLATSEPSVNSSPATLHISLSHVNGSEMQITGLSFSQLTTLVNVFGSAGHQP